MDKVKEFEVGCRLIGVNVTEKEAEKLYKLATMVQAGDVNLKDLAKADLLPQKL